MIARIFHRRAIELSVMSGLHYIDVMMASWWRLKSRGEDQRKGQSSASLAFVQGFHRWPVNRWPVNSPLKSPVRRIMFPFDDVMMLLAIQWYGDHWVYYRDTYLHCLTWGKLHNLAKLPWHLRSARLTSIHHFTFYLVIITYLCCKSNAIILKNYHKKLTDLGTVIGIGTDAVFVWNQYNGDSCPERFLNELDSHRNPGLRTAQKAPWNLSPLKEIIRSSRDCFVPT